MIIVTQDRDALLAFEDGDILETKKIVNEGVFHGVNIQLHGVILGTYGTMREVIAEIQNIINCMYLCYVMGGFEDYAEDFN